MRLKAYTKVRVIFHTGIEEETLHIKKNPHPLKIGVRENILQWKNGTRPILKMNAPAHISHIGCTFDFLYVREHVDALPLLIGSLSNC
jgi:hypothetical protein